MSAIDSILEELNREAKTTRRVLERLPTDKLGWRPHAKSKSLGELGWHVATIPHRIASAAQLDDIDVSTAKPAPLPETAAGILAGFDELLPATRELLGKFDDAALARTITMRFGAVTVFQGRRADFLRTVLLNHGYHHRGQLTVYLRLLDIPVPPVYGPTADER